MNFSLGNIWYLLLLLLLPVIAWLLFGFKKWKSERRNIFAEAQFQEDLFPKDHQFSKFFPVLYLLAFVFSYILTTPKLIELKGLIDTLF